MEFTEIKKVPSWYLKNGFLDWDIVEGQLFAVKDKGKVVSLLAGHFGSVDLRLLDGHLYSMPVFVVSGIESRIEGKGYASFLIDSLIQWLQGQTEGLAATFTGNPDSIVSQFFIRRGGQWRRDWSIDGYSTPGVVISFLED